MDILRLIPSRLFCCMGYSNAMLVAMMLCVGNLPPVLAEEPINKLHPIAQNGQYGYMNVDGEIVIEPQYLHGGWFRYGLANVKIAEDEWGYIDANGRFIDEERYAYARSFDRGVAYAITNIEDGNRTFIVLDARGAEIRKSGPIRGRPYAVSEGLVVFYLEERPLTFAVVDTNGDIVIHPHQFRAIVEFHEGLAVALRVVDEQKTAIFIDREGKQAIPRTFDHALHFSDGLPPVRDQLRHDPANQQWYYIDRTARRVFDRTFNVAKPFSEGLAVVGDYISPEVRKFGYVDREGFQRIPFHFEQARPFSEGRAAVQLESAGKWGFVNHDGDVIIDFEFDSVRSFDGGLAWIKMGDDEGYINRQGEWVWRDNK